MSQAILARIDEDSINLSRRGEGHQISDEARAGLGHPRNRRGEDEIATILASKLRFRGDPILALTVSRMTQTRLASPRSHVCQQGWQLICIGICATLEGDDP